MWFVFTDINFFIYHCCYSKAAVKNVLEATKLLDGIIQCYVCFMTEVEWSVFLEELYGRRGVYFSQKRIKLGEKQKGGMCFIG